MASQTLYAVGGLYLLIGVLAMVMVPRSVVELAPMVVVYLGLGWWANRMPLPAAIIGWLLYVVWMLSAILRGQVNAVGVGVMLLILAALAWPIGVNVQVSRRTR
jgi:hypothetical protein